MTEGISFARKYRPNHLNQCIGNEGIKDSLFSYLKNAFPQTMLLTGNTGCGKTTFARAIVKEYLCLDRDPEGGACGVCQYCQLVDGYIQTGDLGSISDVYEVDVAEKSGKNDIDSVLQQAEYPSMMGWKVFIFDECHEATSSAQSRMLKIVEEPPQNVLMIFCTTDPQKLLSTIKNRCQLKLRVTKPNTGTLTRFLGAICDREDREYDYGGLRAIATRSDFVIRDALNNLERVLTARGEATAIAVQKEFQEVSEGLIFDFFKAYLEKDHVSYMGILYKVKTSFDFEQFLITLNTFTTRGLYILNSVDVEGLTKEEIELYLKLFKQFNAEQIAYVLKSLRDMNRDKRTLEEDLCSFIYCEPVVSAVSNEKVVTVVENSKEEETSFRSAQRKEDEASKLQSGISSLETHMGTVGFEEMLSLFPAEEVK